MYYVNDIYPFIILLILYLHKNLIQKYLFNLLSFDEIQLLFLLALFFLHHYGLIMIIFNFKIFLLKNFLMLIFHSDIFYINFLSQLLFYLLIILLNLFLLIQNYFYSLIKVLLNFHLIFFIFFFLIIFLRKIKDDKKDLNHVIQLKRNSKII